MATFEGTPGPDTFHGTSDQDHVYGRDGNDRLHGGGGGDVLEGGYGARHPPHGRSPLADTPRGPISGKVGHASIAQVTEPDTIGSCRITLR